MTSVGDGLTRGQGNAEISAQIKLIYQRLQAADTLTHRWDLGKQLEELCTGRHRRETLVFVVKQINQQHGPGTASHTTLIKMTQLHRVMLKKEATQLQARGLTWRQSLKLMRFLSLRQRAAGSERQRMDQAWGRFVNARRKLTPEYVEQWMDKQAELAPRHRVYPGRFKSLPDKLERFKEQLAASPAAKGRVTAAERHKVDRAINTLCNVIEKLNDGR
jgi:hypothetical protein